MKRAKKSLKGFSLIETMIALLLSGILLYVLTGWITFISFASKNFTQIATDLFPQSLVHLKRVLNHIDYDVAPLRLDATSKECTFAYKPHGLERKKNPLVFAKLFVFENRLYLEKRGEDNGLIEKIPLLKQTENLKISLLGFLSQENKTSFVEIEDLKPSDSFIPISLRFETKNKSFDVDLPTLYTENLLLHLHLSPTKREKPCS
jgi:prepilin-type N-terminal cleavage/methylation domain-containing protein